MRNMSITLFALSLSITVIIALHPFSFVLYCSRWQVESEGFDEERDEERKARYKYRDRDKKTCLIFPKQAQKNVETISNINNTLK
jgi:hypothetical protein